MKPEDFSKLCDAYVKREITYEQLKMADEMDWDLESVKWWFSTSWWEKIKIMLGIGK